MVLTQTQRNAIRKIAKKELGIPKSRWINVFPVSSTQFMITYKADRHGTVERREMLILNRLPEA